MATGEKGTLFVVTGPSGAGKDSVISGARQRLEAEGAFGSITTTTSRPMRSGEAEGSPYYFISRDEFERKMSGGEMIEWAEVYGNYYGSTREEVARGRRKHAVVVIKVDPQGARTFKQLLPDVITIFIQPPSFAYLEKRLINRASDSPEVIHKRLETARAELQQLDQWDHRIVNEEGQLESAIDAFIALIHSASEQSS